MGLLSSLLSDNFLDYKLREYEHDPKTYLSKAMGRYNTDLHINLNHRGNENQTDIMGNEAIEVFMNFAGKNLRKKHYEILFVGLGTNALERRSISAPIIRTHFHLPYLCALLKSRKTDFSVTALDINGDNIEFVRNMDRVEIPYYTFLQNPDAKKRWNEYLELVKCRSHSANTIPGRDYFGRTSTVQTFSAPVPKNFRSKITYIEGDIATTGKFDSSPFDLVMCTNVLLYFTGNAGKRLAVNNMAKNTNKGGLLRLHDMQKVSDERLFTRDFLNFYGLDCVAEWEPERMYIGNFSKDYIFKKIR